MTKVEKAITIAMFAIAAGLFIASTITHDVIQAVWACFALMMAKWVSNE